MPQPSHQPTNVSHKHTTPTLNLIIFTCTIKESLEIIRDALREDWSLPEFEQRLRSGAGVAHAEVLLRFFKSHSVRMRDSLATSHVWNDTLSSLAWRVDVKTKSRKGTLLTIPIHID
jgi:hypothetical protein